MEVQELWVNPRVVSPEDGWLGQGEPEEGGQEGGGRGVEFDSGDLDGDVRVGISIAGVQNVILLIAQSINGL